MTKEARELYNAYMKDWRKKHPEKNQEYKARYWERKADKMQQAMKDTQQEGQEVCAG